MITGAVVLDHWGIVKTDVGVRDGRIVALGKAGNPDTMDGVDPRLVIGPSTEIIAGNGKILTAGAIDCHVHFVCPQIVDEALAAGINDARRRRDRPGRGDEGDDGHSRGLVPRAHARSARRRSGERRAPRQGQHRVGRRPARASARRRRGTEAARGLGSTPAAIDACLRICDETGVQAAIHTDTLNEAGYVQSTLAAIAGRTIHAYHTEGAGGGHAPDIITGRVAPQRLALVDEPHSTAHAQHDRRAPRHVDGVSPPEPGDPRGSRVRREPHPPLDDRGGGRVARHGCDLDDRFRLAGDGSRRRGRGPHLADGTRDEASARGVAGRRSERQPRAPAATSRSTRSRPRSPTGSTARSAPSRSASLPILCSGSLRSSACARMRC